MDYEHFLKRLGAAIKRRRCAALKSQGSLSHDADTDQSTISRLERGIQGFDAAQIVKIAAALDCPLSDLIAEAENIKLHHIPDEAAKMAEAFMRLPPPMRSDYYKRIQALAIAYREPVPDEKLADWSTKTRKHKVRT